MAGWDISLMAGWDISLEKLKQFQGTDCFLKERAHRGIPEEGIYYYEYGAGDYMIRKLVYVQRNDEGFIAEDADGYKSPLVHRYNPDYSRDLPRQILFESLKEYICEHKVSNLIKLLERGLEKSIPADVGP